MLVPVYPATRLCAVIGESRGDGKCEQFAIMNTLIASFFKYGRHMLSPTRQIVHAVITLFDCSLSYWQIQAFFYFAALLPKLGFRVEFQFSNIITLFDS